MLRDRAWRRHTKDSHTVRRIKNCMRSHWWGFMTSNGYRKSSPGFVDYINTDTEFKAKTLSTTSYDSRNKVKYSPNRSREYWRVGSTRESDKRNFRKILKEYGII